MSRVLLLDAASSYVEREQRPVNPARPFILRPVATSLLMAAILLVSIVVYTQQPVSAHIDPYVDVVIAQTTLLTDQQNLANAQIEQMTSSVQLIEALGGGWDPSQLPTPEQVTRKPSKADTTIQR
jgi:hypothetical protein